MKPKIGITIGDPAGIGPEITAKTLSEREVFNICTPIIIGNEKLIRNELKILKIEPSEDNFSFYDIEDQDTRLFVKGSICPISAKASYNYILKAAKLAKEKKIDAIVTCPITKASLKKAEIPYIDHTEIFKSLFKENPITFLATNDLRTTFVMRHLSLMDSILKLTEEKIFATIIETHNALQKYYKIKSPKIIVTGVNPHNGDFGLLGNEEETLVSPAVKRALSEGLNIVGPIAADSAFPKAIEEKADGVVSMFHDQGHIAIKTNNWKKSIGITLGLPIIRTSVDHGSALDIAGRGIAYNDSLIAAIKEAVKLVNIKSLKQPYEDQKKCM
jgi:4-phospho-D-threonate 3-dehydrogenase / 4-phospho-D-erythronate 3-dehydrogenase